MLGATGFLSQEHATSPKRLCGCKRCTSGNAHGVKLCDRQRDRAIGVRRLQFWYCEDIIIYIWRGFGNRNTITTSFHDLGLSRRPELSEVLANETWDNPRIGVPLRQIPTRPPCPRTREALRCPRCPRSRCMPPSKTGSKTCCLPDLAEETAARERIELWCADWGLRV